MDNILKELNTAFQILSNIPVRGEDVDMMAVARTKLRKVYKELESRQDPTSIELGDSAED